jgi:spermidine synthase
MRANFIFLDDRLVEYKFEEVLLDTYSPYQHIQVLKTIDHGNMLILDGAINLAEHDTTAYTHTIMDLERVRRFLFMRFLIY